MTDPKQSENKGVTTSTQEKKQYEPPAIIEEGSFETVVLSCGHGDFGSCGPAVSS